MLVGVVFGAAHFFEHVVQVAQIYVLRLPTGSGVLGSVADVEPVHFIYNGGYFILVVATALSFTRHELIATNLGQLVGFTTMSQSWHMFEHAVKMAQYLTLNVNGTGGVLGAGPGGVFPLLPVPLLHFAYNVLVYVPFLWAWALTKRSAVLAS